ncbi:hypothetical protein LTR53_011475 [Teratosphaeriaceae sp. CCFEE 6253]|nr:hypothetical protein LTR53_011475 [Teratosphaeriaceae sp. CCFEE 6253]
MRVRLLEKRPWTLPSARQGAITFLGALLIAVFVRHFVVEANDPYRCRPLINSGHWYDEHSWLVPGCVTEGYDVHKIHGCAHGRRIVLAGDAQNQGLYWALVEKLGGQIPNWGPVEQDLTFADDRTKLEYLWDPYLNRTESVKYAEAYGRSAKESPALMVVGGGDWHAKHRATTAFSDAIGHLASAASPNGGGGGVGSRVSARDGPGDVLLFAPVRSPIARTNDATKTGSAYHDMNTFLRKRSDEGTIDVLWSFSDMSDPSGAEVRNSEELSKKQADLILNLRCNAKTTSGRNWSHIRPCCATWLGPNWIQASFLILGLILLPGVVLLDWIREVLAPDVRTALRACCAFMAAVSLQYVADRTRIFEQAARLPLQTPNLYGMIVVIVLIGLVSIRRSKSPKHLNPGDTQPDQPFLPRDQSDEWKGWMQALIIVYHYNMAWSALWFWEIIRLAVSSYLFLTGFGHTVYFLQKRDYSLRRVVAVMIRTNLLPVSLAYLMGTRWLLYYYMPLSSFWFLVVYLTMAIGSAHNHFTPFLIGKILTSAWLVRTFINTKELPETVVRLLTLTCKMSFDAKAFFDYRVRIDEYIVYVGMLAAIFYVWSKAALASDTGQSRLSRIYRRVFPALRLATIGTAVAAFIGFWYNVHNTMAAEAEWTSWQPYDTFVPILAFLIIRNAHPHLRNFHSAAFAWLGRYSGEMYVMQDHLWLAGDQEAVLRTGLFHGNDTVSGDRWRDLLLVTPLYLIACCIIGDATARITSWLISEKKPNAEPRPGPARDNRVRDEVEMGLLAGSEEHQREADLDDEKPLAKQRIWQRLHYNIWPSRVRDRAILLLAGLWVLNMTY